MESGGGRVCTLESFTDEAGREIIEREQGEGVLKSAHEHQRHSICMSSARASVSASTVTPRPEICARASEAQHLRIRIGLLLRHTPSDPCELHALTLCGQGPSCTLAHTAWLWRLNDLLLLSDSPAPSVIGVNHVQIIRRGAETCAAARPSWEPTMVEVN